MELLPPMENQLERQWKLWLYGTIGFRFRPLGESGRLGRKVNSGDSCCSHRSQQSTC